MEDQAAGEEGPKVARAGRRARQAQLMQSEQVVEQPAEDRQSPSEAEASSHQPQPPSAPVQSAADDDTVGDDEPSSTQPVPLSAPPEKRQGFQDAPSAANLDPLADDNKKFTGVSRRKQAQQVEQQQQVAKARNKYEERATTAEISDIPELEEEGKEDLTRVVASAPKVRANRIQGMEELEEDQQYRLPAHKAQDIDLSLLTTVLCSSDMVYEPDEVWDPELLLSQVAAEINATKDTGLEPRESFADPMSYPM